MNVRIVIALRFFANLGLRYGIRFGLGAAIGLSALGLAHPARAQDGATFLQEAIPLAVQSQRETGVPASVTLAQAVWETGRGVSPIGEAKNYFGIKASVAADGTVQVGPLAEGWVWAWTKEWNGARYVAQRERFRKYRTMQDSFRDHGLLLATAPRYRDAMRAVDDPREFARRIAAAGYATSPTYAADLIRVMDAENFYQYDLPRNAAQLLGQSETLSVNPGEIFQIYFDTRNAGFGAWSPTAQYALANLDDQAFHTQVIALDQLVPPERVKRWVITLFAPQTPGMYTTAWQMQHGENKFGPRMEIQVNVRAKENYAWRVGLGIILLALGGGGAYVWRARRKTKSTRA